MGVLGLTRWSSESERLISSEWTLPVPQSSSPALVDGEPAQLDTDGQWLVIDAWAWVHYVWHSMNTNVYQGGSMVSFRLLLGSWITTLRSAGFRLVVIIDGPRLHQKLQSTLSRTQNYVRLNAKLMRAGMNLRTDAEFEHGRILPAGLSECLFSVLDAYKVETQVGAEEVDVAIAQLANQREGYVVSRDSDFLILCGNAPECKGYIPLSTLEFIAKGTAVENQEEPPAEEDDGFTTVSTAKSKRGKKQQAAAKLANLPYIMRKPVLPLDESQMQQTAVRFRCFSSGRVASQLKIPMNLLSVFGALVGTEQRSNDHQELFNTIFHGVNNRMSVIAQVLAEQYTGVKEAQDEDLSDSQAGEYALDLRDPVLRLLAKTLDALVEYGRKRRGAQITVSWEMRHAIVHNMHSVALSYMPGNRDEAIERFMEKCDVKGLQLYQEAYWKRQLDQVMVSVLLERMYIARIFLEEPEEPASQRYVLRDLRELVWSILLSVWLEAHPEAKQAPTELIEQMEKAKIQGDQDQSIDSHEEDQQPTSGSASDVSDEESDEADDQSQPTEEDAKHEAYVATLPKITEYTRTEYALRREELHVRPWTELLQEFCQRAGNPPPKALQEAVNRSESESSAPVYPAELQQDGRMQLWTAAHYLQESDLSNLPKDLWAFVAAMRYTIVANHQRLGELRTKHNWTYAEVEAAVYSAVILRNLHNKATPAELQTITEAYLSGSPPNRSITLSTMLAFALETSYWLTQSLLLVEEVGHGEFEAPLFHARLAEHSDDAWSKYQDKELVEQVLKAIVQGCESRLGRPRAKSSGLSKAQTPRPRRHHGWLSETTL
ncbi:hypothetical protein MYAM1_003953 [Malassezia yamatoensis]|uniref:PIN domain-like protein n=1 Tax=Malassezia yamatoensis TaxID=253288 RepID=A0AAJ5YVU4_9BASI|nr:hypothetical protein MYAM1_003953 [Malassezia yamatoensis]